MSTLLHIKDISCRYQSTEVFNKLNFHVNEGNISCLLGPSGCGKTTVLRAVAGFEPVVQGEIRLRGQVVSRPGFTLPPEKRHLAMVFQDYALFPHLDVIRNVGFGLRQQSPEDQKRRARDMLAIVGLDKLERRYPHELSGGQQQRVALARALASKPDLILFDEPLSNLDVELRERLGGQVREILKEQNIAAILVTHDQHEAFAIADQVAVMDNGKILQTDTPFNLYHDPADRFVADFIGQGVFVNGTMVSHDTVETELGTIVGDRAYKLAVDTKVELLVRPDDIVPKEHGELRAEVVKKVFKGAQILYTLKLASGTPLLSLMHSHHDHQPGDVIGIDTAFEHLVLFACQ